MAGGNRGPSITKRQKERNRHERKQRKAERLVRRKAEKDKDQDPTPVVGEDPDLAGIVPGPQPLPWEQ